MKENTIASAAVALRISTRKACMGKPDARKKSTFPLEAKVLFLIKDRPLTPNNLIAALCVQKSNLAILARGMEQRQLLLRKKLPGKRDTAYCITAKGEEYLNAKLAEIEENFKKFLSSEKEYDEAVETLEAALRLLSFIGE